MTTMTTRWCAQCGAYKQLLGPDAQDNFVAYGNAHVVAYENAHVEAYGNAHVVAYGNAHVEAYGNAHVVAYENAHVEAYGNAHVVAHDNAHVEAYSPLTVTIVRSPLAQAQGGRIVDAYRQEPTAQAWLAATQATVQGEYAILYHRTAEDLATQRGCVYTPGTWVRAADWDPSPECGGGLHFCALPGAADQYRDGPGDRYVACLVPIAEIVVHEQPQYPDKIKASRCWVIGECDREGKPIGPQHPEPGAELRDDIGMLGGTP